MSRLDSFIRRLEAQRTLLNWAAEEIGGRPGTVLEIGLGNGRTYDHLREKMGGRAIYAFDRAVNANPRSIPPDQYLVLGDFSETLPAFANGHAEEAVLIHYDAGLGDPAENHRQVSLVGSLLPPLATSGAILLSDQAFSHPELLPQVPPASIPANRYFVYTRR